MSSSVAAGHSTLIPNLRYRDAPAAIDWLCAAFGFARRFVHPHPDGSIAHAQLTRDGGMVMLSSVVDNTDFSKLMRQPDEVGMAETQTPYLVVADCDAVYATAVASGAKMVIDIADVPHGGRAFSCRDPEGHLWNIGSYDPWA